MPVIHGVWAQDALCVWGRFDRAAELADSLAELDPPVSDLARKAVEAELTLRLPATRNRLADRRVQALAFEPAAALALLDAIGDLDGTLRYLAAVGRFAADLAGRGRVLPVLAAEGGGYAARWRPVLVAADAEHARDLATAMPPVCRAVVVNDAVETNAGAVLSAALDALTDAAVRTRLQAPLLPASTARASAPSSVAERTVAALTGPDASVSVADESEAAEAADLVAALNEWLVIARAPGGPARTCFRLVEPAEGSQDWRVEFALQSTTDPSLLVAAADVWAGVGGFEADPVETLLAGLGRASRVFRALEQALRDAAPTSVTLDTQGALAFLRETGPLLSGAGFGVLLPDWVRRARLGLKLTTRSRSGSSPAVASSRFRMADLVDFRVDLAVGDQTLTEEELAELAWLKVPLVRLRGQWVELDERHLRAALSFLEQRRQGTMTAAEALSAGLHGFPVADDTGLDEIPLAGVDADGWLGDLLSGQADRRLEPVPAPSGFRGTLRPYQERGLAWLAFLDGLGLGGILADDMGLGKTIQLLALVAASRGAGPTLLVCPMSVVGNWQHEAATFTPSLLVHVHHGSDRLEGEALTAALTSADLVITTYGIAARDRSALSAVTWARVVCDEAQTIKNHATRQAQAVRTLPATSRIALTGTPVENRLSELWSIMDFTNPGLLGPAGKFREAYAIPVERHGDDEAAARLKRVTQPFMLRRLKTDKSIISDLPDKQEMKVWCNLTAEQASLYQATVDDMMSRIESAGEGIERRGLVLATMAKLKQVCNHPAHLLRDGSRLTGRSGKLARLEEICDEIIAEGDKALCFTQYAEFGHMLQPYLETRLGSPVMFLHGGSTKKQRDAMVARFASLTEPAIFLLSLKAGGTGLNLTPASHVIHVDRWWNPAVEDQATDRAFRIGQQRNVQVRKFVCVGTLEERIDEMIEDKKRLAERIVGTGENWLTSLSVAELRDVLALSPEAVSE